MVCYQREQVRALANEESSAFSKDDDIGNVTSHQIEIYLNDKTLVQQNHNSIRITLYDELKNYTESLLNITSCDCQKERWIITTLLQLPQSEFKDHNRLAPISPDTKHY